MAEPRRIQLRRTKGWRLPEGAVVVSRQSKLWGNPFKIGALVEDPESGRIPPQPHLGGMAPGEQGVGNLGGGPDGTYIFEVRFILSAADAVALFIRWAAHVRDQETGLWFKDLARNDLAGRDLACWCGPNAACHADVLLAFAAGRRAVTPDVPLPGGGYRMAVKRCCNGCGDQLGDVTDDEIACAIDGRTLPDARNECPRCTPALAKETPDA